MLLRDERALISELIIGALGITNEHKIIFYDNSPRCILVVASFMDV